MFKDKTDKFGTGLNKGIQLFQSDFGLDLAFLVDTYNVSSGINEGLGPRYGMSAIPWHNLNEAVAFSFPLADLWGLHQARYSPSATGNGGVFMSARASVCRIFAVPVGDYTDFSKSQIVYFYLTGTTDLANALRYISISHGVKDLEGVGDHSYNPSSLLTAGPHGTSYVFVTTSQRIGWLYELLYKAPTLVPEIQSVQTLKNINFQSSALISVSGSDTVADWLFGICVSDGDATTTPNIQFTQLTPDAAVARDYEVFCAAPPEWNLRNFSTNERTADVYTFNNTAVNTGQFNIKYRTASFSPTSIYTRQTRYGATGNHIGAVIGSTKLTAGVTYTSNDFAVWNDPLAKINSSYKAILVAIGRPIGFLVQDWALSPVGTYVQQFDPTINTCIPVIRPTVQSAGGAAAPYSENGSPVQTSFDAWPLYVSGTAMVAGTYGPSFGGIGTGLLRASTDYEFTFSVFNKRLGFETNVGTPVKFRTSTNDFVSLIISTNSGTAETGYSRKLAADNRDIMYWPSGLGVSGGVEAALNTNDLEYRFYYRPLGSYEWLPALFISAVQYWFQPFRLNLTACATAIAGLPGGQPGGFSDYSPLNNDNYTCVLTYKDRVWWFSDRAIRFSLARNVFAYPQRNSIGSVTGTFLGAIVHNYPGQAEQNSRLVIFATDAVYVGRFSGEPQVVPIQVAPISFGGDPIVNNFPLDGSDFVMDSWTSNTAFSYRSAVVAEGILYWWGPKGIFRDDGVQTPTKISKSLEPLIFGLPDPQFLTFVHAYYNATTKEILWFYTPTGSAVAYPPTGAMMENQIRAIVYNIEDETFTFARFDEPIDTVFDLTVNWQDNDMTGVPGSSRPVAVARTQTLPANGTFPIRYAYQLPYFFDSHNRAGDLRAERMLMVNSVTYPTVGNAKLVRFGIDNTYVLSSITVGDIIALQANLIASGYGTALDAVGTVTAVSVPSAYVEVTFDTDNVITPLSVGAVSAKYRFTIYDSAFNGIAWKMTTAYWMPKGVNYWANWLYAFFLFKFNKWLGTAPTITVSHRTPVSGAADTDTMTLSDNSDGNCQIYHPLTVGDMSWEGQALKLVLSGTHIGHEWVLQYLEAHAMPLDGDQLKIFEG